MVQGGAGWCRKDCRVEQGGAGKTAGWSRKDCRPRVEQDGGQGGAGWRAGWSRRVVQWVEQEGGAVGWSSRVEQ